MSSGRGMKAVGCALAVAIIGALPMTGVAEPMGIAGRAPCHPGKQNGFRLYCHVAVKFKLDARRFSFKGGSCGHGRGEWGFSAGPGAVSLPPKGWTLSVHFGTQDYGKGVDKDGK